ncbi:MAG: hypothetical protein MUO40_01895, partial [Anaerolineaceae bacterium]|nr:hypothetical protein [Anaerolineaceae bacterium]
MKIFIIPTKTNQMCNRMFLFGNIIATAIEHNAVVINTAFSEFSDYFVGTQNDAFCRFPNKRTPHFLNSPKIRNNLHRWIEKVAHSAKSGNLSRILKNSLVYVDSGWTSTVDEPEGEKALDTLLYKQLIQNRSLIFFDGPLFTNHPGMYKHKAQIKAFFQPVREIQANVEAFTEHLHDEVDLLIGVHMRLGDYASFSGGRFMFTPAQYSEKMHQAQALFPGKKVRFLITSNEKQDSNYFSEFDHVIGNGHPIEDLYSLAKCDYITGPPS